MNLSYREVIKYFDPWPIVLPKTQYKLTLIPMSRAVQYKAFWPDEKNKRHPISFLIKKIVRKNYLGKQHQIESISKHLKQTIPVIIVNQKRVIIDGNHRLCAMILNKYKGPVLVIQQK